MADAGDFGKKACIVPGYEDCWVQFKTTGYPRKLRDEWDGAIGRPDSAAADIRWGIVLRYVEAWQLRDVDGESVALPPLAERTRAVLDNVEDAIVVNLPSVFLNFWINELTAARPNS